MPEDGTRKQHIIDLINQYGIYTAVWGNGTNKSIDDLIAEVDAGESTLAVKGGELLRTVGVAGVTVYTTINSEEHVLYEDRQEFPDGSTRRRNLTSSLGEKITRGEDPADAAARGIREELGIVVERNLLTYVSMASRYGESRSYPGLRTEWHIYHYSVIVSGDAVCPEGYYEEREGRKTYFLWRRVDEINGLR